MKKEIRGKNIILRRLKLRDFYDLYLLLNDSSISKYYTSLNYPFNLLSAIKYVLKRKILTMLNYKTNLRFAIQLKGQNKLVGEIGLYNNFKDKNCEISYWIGKEYRGKGICSESISLILNFAFNELKMNKIIARTIEYNIISKKLLEKHGFKLEGVLTKNRYYKGNFYDEFIYGLLKKDFLKNF